MRFLLLIGSDSNANVNKIRVTDSNRSGYGYYAAAEVKTTSDWGNNEEYPVVTESSSIQIRPKALYKNSKGTFYKTTNGSVYLKKEEVLELSEFIWGFRAKCDCENK